VESSLQGISSNSLLWKQNNWCVIRVDLLIHHVWYAVLQRDSPCIRVHINIYNQSTHVFRASVYNFLPPTPHAHAYKALFVFPISPSFHHFLVPYLMQTKALWRYFVIVGQPVRTCWYFSCNLDHARVYFGNLEFESLYTRLSCGSLCSYYYSARC